MSKTIGFIIFLITIFSIVVCASDNDNQTTLQLSGETYGQVDLNSKENRIDKFMGGILNVKNSTENNYKMELVLGYNSNRSFDTTTYSSLNIQLEQCYVSFPLDESTWMNIGQKIRNIGFGGVFNVTNRISLTEIGVLEGSMVLSESMSGGMVFSLNNSSKIEDAQTILHGEYQCDNMSINEHLFFQDRGNLMLGTNASLQLNTIKLYTENIIKKNSEQYKWDRNEFKRQNNSAIECIAGIQYSFDKIVWQLEYMYRSEGVNAKEQEDEMINNVYRTKYYTQEKYLAHYVGVALNIDQFPQKRMSLSCQLKASIQPERFEEFSGGVFSVVYNKNIGQNTNASITITQYFGGEKSEYTQLMGQNRNYTLKLDYSF